MKANDLDYVVESDGLRFELSGKPILLHNQHRWILSIIHWAQQQNILYQPCTIVSLDAHRDWAGYRKYTGTESSLWKKILSEGVSHRQLQEYLTDDIDDNGQWIVTGADFGLIDNAFLIGGQLEHDDDKRPFWHRSTDHNSLDRDLSLFLADYNDVRHEVIPLRIYVEEELGGQCINVLAETFDSDIEKRRWLLCRDRIKQMKSCQFLATIDLDFFIAKSDSKHSELWTEQALIRFLSMDLGDNVGRESMTIGDMLREVIHEAALVVIAAEPKYTGSQANIHTALRWIENHLGLALPRSWTS
ncbi:MAG: hypothetical protein KKH67_03585 [candidate division Zixibacteria bacterium]|nr:hypothetical protein [candidate division Zixibacteria bacterium]